MVNSSRQLTQLLLLVTSSTTRKTIHRLTPDLRKKNRQESVGTPMHQLIVKYIGKRKNKILFFVFACFLYFILFLLLYCFFKVFWIFFFFCLLFKVYFSFFATFLFVYFFSTFRFFFFLALIDLYFFSIFPSYLLIVLFSFLLIYFPDIFTFHSNRLKVISIGPNYARRSQNDHSYSNFKEHLLPPILIILPHL